MSSLKYCRHCHEIMKEPSEMMSFKHMREFHDIEKQIKNESLNVFAVSLLNCEYSEVSKT